jgi:hypothetical protein
MKLLSVDVAQSFWYGQTKDFNPRGIAWGSVIIPWLVSTYKFKTLPDRTKKESEGIKFQNGEFMLKEGELPISVDFSIFPGGLIVDTRCSTDASDGFLVDLFTKLSKDFAIPPYTEIIREKKYFSQLWVLTDKSLDVLNPKLQKLNSFLSKYVHGGGIDFEVGGISFWPEQTAQYPPSPFLIERAAGIPFSEKRYFSRAPLKTDQHLGLLNILEETLSDRNRSRKSR